MKLVRSATIGLCGALLLAAATGVATAADERVERLTPEHRKWLEEEVVYIITDREREVFLSLETVEERERFIEAFWERRDPNPATPENEFKIEHYRRIAHANHYFGREAPRPGWMTDRGKFYIILGEPREVQRYEGLNDIVSTELWIYDGDTKLGLPPRFNLLFYRPDDIGEYELYHPAGDGPEALLRAGHFYRVNQNAAIDQLEIISMDLAIASITVDLTEPVAQQILSGRNTRDPLLLQVRPSMVADRNIADILESPKRRVDEDYLEGYLRYRDRVSAEYSFKFVPNKSYFAVLVGPDNTPFIHYSVELAPQHLTMQADEDRTAYFTTLDATFEVRDLNGHVVAVHENTAPLRLTASEIEQVKAHPFAYQEDFPFAVPGTFDVSLTLRNRVTKQFTVAEKRIEIPAVDGTPRLTSLVTGYRRELIPSAADTAYRVFQIGTDRIHPAVENAFAIGDTLVALTQAVGASPRHRVRFTLLDEDGTELQETEAPVGERFGAAIGELSLLKMQGGRYRLTAELVDPEDGAVVAEASAPVNVSPRTSIPRPGFAYRWAFNADVPGLLDLARGRQFLTFGLLDEARRELEEAVALGGERLPAAAWTLAKTLLYLREPDRAYELLAPLEEQYGDEYEVAEGLGYVHYFRKDYATAASYFEKAMTIRPPDTSLLNALGDSYEELGRPEKAKEVYERSLSLNPEQQGVKQRLASLDAAPSPQR